jgi:osmotically-inducible protein OsmY
MNVDTELQEKVLDELKWEPGIESAEIGVSVSEGVVTLNGHVPSFMEKLLAERAAQRIKGVRAVANGIAVRIREPHMRDDSEIAKAAADALKWNAAVAAQLIKVSVTRGWIMLEGEVDWQLQKTAAEEAVHALSGVKGVTNLIHIKPTVSANEVRSRIESAFRRNAELDAQGLVVETKDGKVTLRGSVRSWAERQEAERSAWAAPGIATVENLLSVSP